MAQRLGRAEGRRVEVSRGGRSVLAGRRGDAGRPSLAEPPLMGSRGFSLLEMTISVGIVLTMAAVAAPMFRARFADAHLLGAAQQFKARFRLAHSTAVRNGVYTAIRFERRADGGVDYSVYADGNGNGVLSADIARGRDRLIEGPLAAVGRCAGRLGRLQPRRPRAAARARAALGRPRPVRRLGHTVVLAARNRDAGHVLPGGRQRPGRRARHRRQRPRAAHAVARRQVAGALTGQTSDSRQ